jgi:hypothetical protein
MRNLSPIAIRTGVITGYVSYKKSESRYQSWIDFGNYSAIVAKEQSYLITEAGNIHKLKGMPIYDILLGELKGVKHHNILLSLVL